MAIKMMVMVRRKPGLTPEEFRNGYENSHARMAVELFGHLWTGYRRNYLTRGRNFARDGVFGPDDLGFDAVSEYVLADEAALDEMQRIAMANLDAIKADEARWFDQAHSWTMACETVEEELAVVRR